MTDWASATERLRVIFAKKVRSIRSDIPATEIAEEAGRAFLAGVLDEEGLLKMDGSGLMSLIGRINSDHRERMVGLAQEIGTVLGHDDQGRGTFVDEDEYSISMRTDGLVIKISKETALKILTLGEIP